MNITRAYTFLDFCLWILNPFLIVLLVFEQNINVGIILQWTGKMHPLFLHFPIVFGIVIALYYLFFDRIKVELDRLFLAINAIFAVVVAILGFFLVNNGEYQGDVFIQHKWSGAAIAMLSWLLLFSLNWNSILKKTVALIFISILIFGTHKGAQITHGTNALRFPLSAVFGEKNTSGIDSTLSVYEIAIQSVLNQKCVSCHGPDKEKGYLRLDSPEHILAGGESGDILGGNSMMMSLIHLPIEEDGHMPPEGKVQLTKEEIDLLDEWIKSGADFNKLLKDSEKEFLMDINNYLVSVNQEKINPDDLPDLGEFNTDYCTVNYLFNGSEKVEVNFFQASFYNQKTLSNLLKIKDKIVQLNIQNMPLRADDLDIIIQFENLEKVNLNSTGLSIRELESLKKMELLRSLSICGIEFTEEQLSDFLADSKFEMINIWTDNIDKHELQGITEGYSKIRFTIGDNLKDKILKMSQAIIAQDSQIIRNKLEVELNHLLNGVDIFYTTDGSIPDSLGSKYTEPILLLENTRLMARAFKKGWIGSDVVEQSFYKSGIQPDTLYLLTDPHPKYPGKGASTLTDLVLGQKNFQNGQWLAYKDYDMEFMVGFNSPTALNSIELNALTKVYQHIFPISSIKAEGSNDGKDFTKIAEINFPDAASRSSGKTKLYGVSFPEGTKFSHYKFIIQNLKRMPEWHEAKGKPAWIFIDELFLN